MGKKWLVLLTSLLIVPICYGGFFDWFKEVTGWATLQTTDLNITVGNSAPTIIDIFIVSSVNPVESTNVNLEFSFTAHDQDGISQFNNASANASFTLDAAGSANGMQLNDTSCDAADLGNNATVQNYTCTITLRYWDRASDWSVNVTVSDSASQAATYNETFTYNSLTAINMTPTSMAWNAVTLTSTDQSSTTNPIIVGNTGNYNITSVNTSAIDLGGETTTTQFITANNFTINIADACSTGTALQNNTAGDVVISGAGLPSGVEVNEQAADELLYLCLEEVPQSISQQSYSTANVGTWSIGIV